MATTQRPRGHILSLPPEVLTMVFSHLDRRAKPKHASLYAYGQRTPRSAAYATVCRQWQPVVERLTFQSLQDLPSTDLDKLAEVFSRSQTRRDSLRSLSMRIVLPDYGKRARRKFEQAKDKAANNQAVTDAVRRLFEILAAWGEGHALGPADFARMPTLSVTLAGAAAPRDMYWWEKPRSEPPSEPRDHKADDFGPHRYEHSYLRLVGLDENPLPSVPRITNLHIEFFMRRMEGASAVAIVKCLPRLEELHMTLKDNEWRYPTLRQQQRYAWVVGTPTDDSFNFPSALRPSSPTTDHLCLALNSLSQLPTLKSFYVGLFNDFVLSPSLFWPEDDVSTIKPDSPFWPSLEHMEVSSQSCTHTGDWYHERDPTATKLTPPFDYQYTSLVDSDFDVGNDSDASWWSLDSSHPDRLDAFRERYLKGEGRDLQFRTMLSHIAFNPVALSFARAVTRMPRLRIFQFKISSPSGDGTLEAEWARAGDQYSEYDIYGQGDEKKHRWTIAVQENARWEVPDELMKILREGVGEDGLVRLRTLE
ncbi:hypothetical protein BDZ91DRAFT_843576 [Kalaharituber pfeilii]|nr:hypothetical protein BDZ91DRAFT_843576 [Kalaharituber pfeilii]